MNYKVAIFFLTIVHVIYADFFDILYGASDGDDTWGFIVSDDPTDFVIGKWAAGHGVSDELYTHLGIYFITGIITIVICLACSLPPNDYY